MARQTASQGLRAANLAANPQAKLDATGFHKVGIYHAHGCEECSRRYTDRCETPSVNGRCYGCRTGRDRAVWDKDQDPRDCCRTESALMKDKAELSKYNLGGPGPWYRCKTCSRTHPYRPGTGATP